MIQSGLDLNSRCDQGASVLFSAILQGNSSIVLWMLEQGADPNLIAEEPAAFVYTERPLALAKQCRFLLDWDKYDPIVALLEKFGATDSESNFEAVAPEDVKQRAREWQAHESERRNP